MGRATPDVGRRVSDHEARRDGDFSKPDVVPEPVEIHDPVAPGGRIHERDAFETYVADRKGREDPVYATVQYRFDRFRGRASLTS